MRQITAWQTSDGITHANRNTALRHAEERYGNALCALAREAVTIDKYQAMIQFLEKALPRFAHLSELSADRVIVGSDSDCDL